MARSKDKPELAGDNVKRDKVTITLAVDSYLLDEVRKEAMEQNQSVNLRVNNILRKHVMFYRMTESHGAAIMHPHLVQFLMSNVKESEFIDEWKAFGIKFVHGYFSLKGIPFSFENFVRYYLGETAIYSGIIRSLSQYVDEKDGKTCLYLRHMYDEKWSRIIGTVYSSQIEQLLRMHTAIKTDSDGVEIKILEGTVS